MRKKVQLRVDFWAKFRYNIRIIYRKQESEIKGVMKKLLIVESPAKAKTIGKYLGGDFVVKSSVGHVRDLPKKGLSIRVKPVEGTEAHWTFTPTYEVSPDKKKIVDTTSQKAGDVLIAIASSGVHSNGFSLVRKVFNVNEQNLARHFADLGATLGECLLTPTRIYVKPILSLLEKVNVKAISHITGGGFYENIPRSLPDGISARIPHDNVQILPIFDLIARTGNIPERDMFNTFNMGVGMIVSVAPEDADAAIASLKASGEQAYVLGELVESDQGVIIE